MGVTAVSSTHKWKPQHLVILVIADIALSIIGACWLGGAFVDWLGATATVSLVLVGGFGLTQIEPLIEANKLTKTGLRATKTQEVLAMFADRVLPAHRAVEEQYTARDVGFYRGPTRPGYVEYRFATPDEILKKKLETYAAVDLLNQLEVFASALAVCREGEIVEFELITKSIAKTYCELVNEVWDVYCALKIDYVWQYEGVTDLHEEWDEHVCKTIAEYNADLELEADLVRPFDQFVWTDVGDDTVVVQAVSKNQTGIMAFPIPLSVNSSRTGIQCLVDDELLTEEPQEVYANSSGAVYIRVQAKSAPSTVKLMAKVSGRRKRSEFEVTRTEVT